jgi:type II secretory pathway component GspD/PulD (secretin)
VRTSTGIFTIVQDGGESTMLVASQVPYPQVAYYRDYLTGAGHVATGVQFRDVGTSLKVRAAILPGNQVRVRLTPTISWLSADRSGVIEVNEASTELVVPSGRPVVLGGATTQTHELTRRILGHRASEGSTETTMALTATIR